MQHATAHRLSPVHISSSNLWGLDEAHCHGQAYTFYFSSCIWKRFFMKFSFNSTLLSFVNGDLKEQNQTFSILWIAVSTPSGQYSKDWWVFCHLPTDRVGCKKYRDVKTLSLEKCSCFDSLVWCNFTKVFCFLFEYLSLRIQAISVVDLFWMHPGPQQLPFLLRLRFFGVVRF